MMTFLLAVLALVQITLAQAERLRWVPNPRTASGTWVADPSHHLKPATVDSLNALLSALSRETGTEMTVVAIDSTSGFEPFDVALALHSHVGCGAEGSGQRHRLPLGADAARGAGERRLRARGRVAGLARGSRERPDDLPRVPAW